MLEKNVVQSARWVVRTVPGLRTAVEATGAVDTFRRWQTQRKATARCLNSVDYFDQTREILFLRGSWKEIGRKIAMATNLEPGLKMAREFRLGLASDPARILNSDLSKTFEYYSQNFPELAQMFLGASQEVNKYDLEDVIFANTWFSLIEFSTFVRSCAAVCVTRSTGSLLGQNLDLGPTNNVVLCHVVPSDGPAMLCHLSPGYLFLSMGVNSNGVVCGGGSVNVERSFEPSPMSLPTSFAELVMLSRAQSAPHAVSLLNELAPYGPTHDGLSLCLSDLNAQTYLVELTSGNIANHKANHELSVATNHFQLNEMSPLNRLSHESRIMFDGSVTRMNSGLRRLQRIKNVRAPHLKALLRNQRGKGAWCRKARGSDTGWTSASYIYDLENATAHYWLGTNPKKKEWKTINLESFFAGQARI